MVLQRRRTGAVFRFAFGLLVLVAVLGHHVTVLAAPAGELLTNGDFETGDFWGWTTFTTANGSLGVSAGPPDVVPFGVSNSGNPSQAARFQVGQESFLPNIPEGGGIFQNFASPGGVVMVRANIASDLPFDFINTDPGSFGLYVDGQLLDALAFGSQFGSIGPFATQRTTMSGAIALGAGVHELRILVHRPALNSEMTPFQYIDDISVSLIPEPSIFVLLAAGSLFLWVARKRCWQVQRKA